MKISVYSYYFLGLIFLGLGLGATCFAGPSEQDEASAIDHLSVLAKQTLTEKFSSPEISAEISFPSIQKLSSNPSFSEVVSVKSVRLLEERANAVAKFEVVGAALGSNGNEKQITKIISLPFEAWVNVPVATHRIYPNTRLKAEDFKVQAVNVATGTAREYRGIMASPATQFSKIQSKQTIVEGQFLTTAAIQREPDIRRGEMVRLELISGDLTLSTQGVAQEAGAIGDRIHVLSSKTKKEVSGLVREDRSIEVKL